MMLLKLLGVSVIACLLAFGAGYFKGKWKAEGECQTAALKAEIALLKHEKLVGAAAESEEDNAKVELETENAGLEKKVSDYAEELAKRPDRCAVTDDDLTRMQ